MKVLNLEVKNFGVFEIGFEIVHLNINNSY